MKIVQKIALLGVAVLAVNTAFAQNALEKRNIKKAEAASEAKSQSSALEKKAPGAPVTVTTATKQQEPAAAQPAQPAAKQAQPAPGSPAQRMNNKPLKKQPIQKQVKATNTGSGK